MLIGVDAVSFTRPAAGVARYLREMLAHMLAVATADEFVLYAPVPFEAQLPPGRWRRRIPAGRSLPGLRPWLRYSLSRMLAEDKVDVYWGQNQMMPPRLPRGCRGVLTVHDVTGLLYPRTLRLRHRLSWKRNFRAAVRAADCTIADSFATARLLRVYLGAEANARVVYPGCSDGLAPVLDAAALDSAQRRLGLPSDFILAVGTIEPRKDYMTLLRAHAMLQPAPVLAIAGGVGWNCAAILREIRRHEAGGRVRYVGPVADQDLRSLYSAAKLSVYASFYEGFGLPVLESMACGCPVLCSWSSSLPEVGGRAARYFRARDAAGLASRMAELLGDERQLAEMRADGIRQAARFSFTGAANRLLGLLQTGAGT